jgi:hypothetical protein
MTSKQLCPQLHLWQLLPIPPPLHIVSPSSPVSQLLFSISFLLDLSGAAGYDVAFIHPRSAVGVLVELVQAPDDVIAALSKKWKGWGDIVLCNPSELLDLGSYIDPILSGHAVFLRSRLFI